MCTCESSGIGDSRMFAEAKVWYRGTCGGMVEELAAALRDQARPAPSCLHVNKIHATLLLLPIPLSPIPRVSFTIHILFPQLCHWFYSGGHHRYTAGSQHGQVLERAACDLRDTKAGGGAHEERSISQAFTDRGLWLSPLESFSQATKDGKETLMA